jgi:hypothetical protein
LKVIRKSVGSGSFEVFDRRGRTIFEANSLADAWDETESNGVKIVYPSYCDNVILATSNIGKSFRKTGSVLLLNNGY